jgi:hypothetical protein
MEISTALKHRWLARGGRLVIVLSVLCLIARSSSHGAPGPSRWRSSDRSAGANGFHVSSDAASQLHVLWQGSTEAKEERVACLGGYRADDVWELTRIEPLGSSADSLGVSARTSIERCGPPDWLGTVHTHVALRDGVSPYATFSGADRGVMRLWWRQWKVAGVFCVLYSEREAHCEVDGELIAGAGTHVNYWTSSEHAAAP